MTGRTEPQAVQNFQDVIQRAVSCITDSVVSVHGGYHVAVEPHSLTLGPVNPVRLGGEGRLSFSIILHYRIVENVSPSELWRIVTTGYFYTFTDAASHEVIAYHWHPNGRSFIECPHLHLESGAQVGRRDIANAHLPIGWVTLNDVIQLAVTELGVTPRREDWRDVLKETRGMMAVWARRDVPAERLDPPEHIARCPAGKTCAIMASPERGGMNRGRWWAWRRQLAIRFMTRSRA